MAQSRMYRHGSTLYIAGTSKPHDLIDDLKLPFGMVKQTERYQEAVAVMGTQDATDPVRRVVGHSLGAAVAKQISRDYGLRYDVYANPGWGSAGTDKHSHRNPGDIISAFDSGVTATRSKNLNPHAYDSLAEQYLETGERVNKAPRIQPRPIKKART